MKGVTLVLLICLRAWTTAEAQAPFGYPLNVQASVTSPTEIEVTWGGQLSEPSTSQVTHYEVQYNQSAFSETTVTGSATTMGPETQILLQDLEEYVEYSIGVRALTSDGPGPFSPSVTARTLQNAPTAPPENFTAVNISANELYITWKPPREMDINGELVLYIIQYHTIDQPDTVGSTDSVSGSTLSRTIRNLDNFTTYSVQVAAFTVGNGPFASRTVTTSENVPGEPPRNVTGSSNSSTSISVEWEPPREEVLYGILRGYSILYSPVDSIINSEEFTQIPPENTAYVVMNLLPGTNYSVQVAAVTIDIGPYSSPIYITTDPYDQNVCLVEVTDLSISSVRSQGTVMVVVTWNGPPPELKCSHHFNLSYSAVQTPPYPSERRQIIEEHYEIINGSQNTFTITNALPFAEYTVIVYPFEDGKEGSAVNMTMRSQAIEPTAVTDLRAIWSDSQTIWLLWDLPIYPNGPISYYTLYYRASNTVQQPPISSSGFVNLRVENTDVNITGLEPSTNYSVHVQAIGTSEGGGILPGLIDREVLVATAGTNEAPAMMGESLSSSFVGGVIGGGVAIVFIAAVTVIIIVALVLRNRRAVFKLKHQSRNITAMVVTNQLAFEMSDCMAYSPTNHNGGSWGEEDPQYGGSWGEEDPQYESITNTTRSGSSSSMDLDPDSNDGYEEIPT